MLLSKVEVHLAATGSSQALHRNNHKQIIKLKKTQLVGGKSVSYLKAWPRGRTRDCT